MRAAGGISLCLLGCAGASAGREALTDRVQAMRSEQSQIQRRVEEMENRLMLIEDRLETRRVAEDSEGRVPTLPVVRVAPSPAAPPLAGPDEATDDASDHDTAVRPVLRLHGSGRQKTPQAPLDLGSVDERLPVAPLPRRPVVSAPAPAPRPPADALKLYRQQHDLVLAGRYAEAQAGFEKFLADFPDHEYADNAAYWIAECHYARKDWPRAISAFRHVLTRYPRGNKAPGALLKLGFSYLQTGDRAAGVQVLEQVTQTYAHADVASLARAKIEEIHD